MATFRRAVIGDVYCGDCVEILQWMFCSFSEFPAQTKM